MRGEEDTRLDPAALEALRELGVDEFLADLVATFLADAPPPSPHRGRRTSTRSGGRRTR
ncbi:MAG: hypothetical protein ACM3QU_08895 [Verrucomicrobiota bacterium]